jgi:hypothetical protein
VAEAGLGQHAVGQGDPHADAAQTSVASATG